MNRKDFIIASVLVNCGFLIVLFIGALSSHSPRGGPSASLEKVEAYPMQKVTLFPRDCLTTNEQQIERMIDQYRSPQEQSSQISPSSSSPAKGSSEEPPVVKKEEASSSPSSESHIVVTVEQGDLLENIARNYQVKVFDLMEVNQLKTARLYAGQTLKIPSYGKRLALSSSTKGEKEGKFYKMKVGDTLWKVARAHRISVEKLLKINNLTHEQAGRLQPGDQIRLS